MQLGRFVRTLQSLRPLQIVARIPRALLVHAVGDFPSGASPRVVQRFPEPPVEVRRFANSERERFLRRLPRLPMGSALRSYEVQYGLELGGEPQGPRLDWRGTGAVDAYPASVRARRIAVAIRCGRKDLGGELARAARAVMMQLEFHLLGNHLLENAIGLVCAASATQGPEADLWWKVGSMLMRWQLAQQFLEDGGHFELSASYHLAVTAGLLEAIELAGAAGRTVPDAWRETAARALGWAVLVRAPDGEYPFFNDASIDSAPSIDGVVQLGRACGFREAEAQPVASEPWFRHLSSTGWLMAGTPDGAWLCIDAGADGAPYQPGHVHADALTFELWVGGRRAIVDYGVSSYSPDAARSETRSTKVHNTVELDGRNSCEVWDAFRVGRRSRARIRSAVRQGEMIEIDVDHDGYSWLQGHPVHRRRFALTAGRLRVVDQVLGGNHAGSSRVRFDAGAAQGMAVNGSFGPTSRSGVWHPNFADTREARVFEQPVSSARECDWVVEWSEKDQERHFATSPSKG